MGVIIVMGGAERVNAVLSFSLMFTKASAWTCVIVDHKRQVKARWLLYDRFH